MGSRRMSRTGSFRGEGWGGPDLNGFSQPTGKEEDEEEFRWAAIERLPTYVRVTRGMLEQVLDGKVVKTQIDVTKLGTQDREAVVPSIDVRYENLSVEGDVYVGSRALPTLLNATLNAI
ncbi:hypothetical protein Tsubulata_005578, partial [Turnera subulata]